MGTNIPTYIYLYDKIEQVFTGNSISINENDQQHVSGENLVEFVECIEKKGSNLSDGKMFDDVWIKFDDSEFPFDDKSFRNLHVKYLRTFFLSL